ncbi:fluoride efflux transporter CrcB [Aliidiomarina taiwanensis]|uniref:Fluoride-specific ion channel FluC n=1 Tax=Aliidiomarina taiwanensis TaxID=946228 RepID=A0A432X9J7_9GAMM|nr:CrcB family protein [Aliidiomarina taiwanensis]RUO44092.1 fluoride efflux transporter CrcB [Aliidiomarina taiwanensis]
MLSLAAVALGGAFGSLLRFMFTEYAKQRWGRSMPATFGNNVLGSFLLGSALAIAPWPAPWGAFIQLGVLGGFTTFSTFILELTEPSDVPLGQRFVYAGASIVACLLAALLGLSLWQ